MVQTDWDAHCAMGEGFMPMMLRNGPQLGPEPPHGTYARYRWRGQVGTCKCAPCRKANHERARVWRQRHAGQLEKIPHGTEGGYTNWSCRCMKCKSEHTRLVLERNQLVAVRKKRVKPRTDLLDSKLEHHIEVLRLLGASARVLALAERIARGGGGGEADAAA